MASPMQYFLLLSGAGPLVVCDFALFYLVSLNRKKQKDEPTYAIISLEPISNATV